MKSLADKGGQEMKWGKFFVKGLFLGAFYAFYKNRRPGRFSYRYNRNLLSSMVVDLGKEMILLGRKIK